MAGDSGETRGADGPRTALRRWLRWVRDHYCTMEPRTAGLFRIALGFLCSADTVRRWVEARRFYSNEGVLTNHFSLYRPAGPYAFSLYHAFSSLGEVHVAFALSVLCHLALLIGWRARLFAVASFVVMTSLDGRLLLVENGGTIVVNLLCFYAMFLPIERRFSADALLRSFRARKERSAEEVNERSQHPATTAPFVSIAVLLVVLNLAAVYFFNVANKSGTIWRRGDTVHYVLHIDRMVTGVAPLLRDALPLPVTRFITWTVVALEALLVPWILSPRARRATRTLAILGICALHVSFGVTLRLGPFAWAMITWSILLLGPEQWSALEAWYRRGAAPRTVIYDRTSPLAFWLVRLLARLDRLELLRFEESSPDNPRPPLLAVGMVGDGAALGEIARALPGGRYGVPFLVVARPLFSLAAAHRAALARYFALAVPPPGPEERDAPSPLLCAWRVNRARAREAFLAYFAVCAVLQALDENKAVPPWMKPERPWWVRVTVGYNRLQQGWGMFAPNPITEDGTITVDARTIDGRRIDPLTGKEPVLDLESARGLGLSQIQQDYFNRIRLERHALYRQGLEEYLGRWHRETGDPCDELVAFDVYWVRDQCPRPGTREPHDGEALAIHSWRKPGYQPPPGLPPLPPEPKVQSAEPRPLDELAEPATPWW